MDSFDGAEICKLVGLFVLSKLAEKFGKENVGLHRDDGLVLIEGVNGKERQTKQERCCMTYSVKLV